MKFIPEEMVDYAKKLPSENLSTALDFKTLYKNCGTHHDQACDLAVTTAARLSASFPYVTPMARNDRENYIKDGNGKKTDFLQNYHIADGGYFDNSGAFTAMEWLNEFLKYNNDSKNKNRINIKKVLLLQVNAFPEDKLKLDQEGNPGYLVDTFGPLNTLAGIRDSTQISRNQTFAQLLKDRWNKDIKIQDFTISFPQKAFDGKTDYNPPLSWRLTERQKKHLEEAWRCDKAIGETVKKMKSFWNGGQTRITSQMCAKPNEQVCCN